MTFTSRLVCGRLTSTYVRFKLNLTEIYVVQLVVVVVLSELLLCNIRNDEYVFYLKLKEEHKLKLRLKLIGAFNLISWFCNSSHIVMDQIHW